MTTLAEIEAATATLPFSQQRMLFDWLAPRVAHATPTSTNRPSLLNIAPVSLGQPLSQSADEDLLGEMLEANS